MKSTRDQSCPICGLPRGKGPYEFVHGPCAEKQAKDEPNETSTVVFNGVERKLKKLSVKKARDNGAKKGYLSGKLPRWMTHS